MDLPTLMASVLPTRLADAAFLYWDSLPPLTQGDYDSVKEKLRDVFRPAVAILGGGLGWPGPPLKAHWPPLWPPQI
jgi:hypothetical protein